MIKSYGLLCYTELTPERDLMSDNQHSGEEGTNKPDSANGGALGGDSVQLKISSKFRNQRQYYFRYLYMLYQQLDCNWP